MNEVFFSATKNALNNITKTYDTVWPIAVGLWNLRCMVNGVKSQIPDITELQLAAKFSLGSGIHGTNFKRSFSLHTWDEQLEEFAWILLNGTIPIYEGWLENLKKDVFPNMAIKKMQFPHEIETAVSSLTTPASPILTNSFYSTYKLKRDRMYAQINELLYCYRVFKEARNCYMHNGGIANISMVEAYSNYLPYATKSSLGVDEVPEFYIPILDEPIKLSLRGVVGFSYIIIKILVSIDTELLCSQQAEKEFTRRYQEKHSNIRTIKSNPEGARAQVNRYIRQCGFISSSAIDEIIIFLLSKNLISR